MNNSVVYSRRELIIGNAEVIEAKLAPIPNITKIIGNAQQKIVENELNNAKNVTIVSFFIDYLSILSTLYPLFTITDFIVSSLTS